MEDVESKKSIVEYKIILLGDKNVGKSSIANRYIMETFDYHCPGTIGTAFFAKTILKENGQIIKLLIWDTCGEEKFRAISSLYFRDCDSVIQVYDLSEPASLEGVEYYIEKLKNEAPEHASIF